MGAFATSNPTGGSDITGSGTANQVAVFTSAQGIGNPTISFTSGSTGFVIGSTTLEASGILTLTSTTQGFIPPRMTTAQRNLITAVQGLMVYNTSNNVMSMYTGAAWINTITTAQMPASYAVGDLLYASSTTALSSLAVGTTDGMFLRVQESGSRLPSWSTLILPNAATINQISYATATNTLGASANFTYDGTTLTVANTSSTNPFLITNTDNSAVGGRITNSGAGAAAESAFFVGNGTATLSVKTLGTTFTTSGNFKAGTAVIINDSANGMIVGSSASATLFFYTANAERWKIDSNGRLAQGGVTPTAKCHIGGSTTAANSAPLKFNSGTLMTTAEAGAFEFVTDSLYFTITTGAARRQIAVLDGGQTFTSAVWNGTLIGAAYGGTGIANNAASTITISGNFGTTFNLSAAASVDLGVWTDWSASINPQGFSSTSTLKSRYMRIGKTIIMFFQIIGTSNATTFTLTLPVAAANNSGENQSCFVAIQNNGVAASANGYTTENSATFTINNGVFGGSWTASGTKAGYAILSYETI